MCKLTVTLLAVFALTVTAGAQSAAVSQTQQVSATGSQKSQTTQRDSQASAAVSSSATSSTSASANAGPASASLDNGSAVNAELLTTIDARKVHPGQRVEAKTTKDVKEGKRVVLRHGTKLIGHVTEAQAHTKANAQSAVGIVFDQAIVGSGETVPFHASIQALAAAQSMAETGLGDDEMMSSDGAMGGGAVRGGGGLVGGATGAVGSTAGVASGTTGNLSRTAGGTLESTTSITGSASRDLRGLDAGGNLISTSSGVFGLSGLNLVSSASNATEGSVITSTNRNVHLSSGTQMLLKMNSQAEHGGQGQGASQRSAPSHKPGRTAKQ